MYNINIDEVLFSASRARARVELVKPEIFQDRET